MAGDKSSEGKNFEFMSKEDHEEMHSGIDWASGKDYTAWSTSINIDCTNALKGLKAVQREAKKATAALKELEEQQRDLKVVISADQDKLNEPLLINRIRKQLGFNPFGGNQS